MAFSYAQFNDEKAGCKPGALTVRDYADDEILSDKLVKHPETIDQFTQTKSSPDSLEWKDKNGNVAIRASFSSEPGVRRIVLRVENLSWTRQITQLDVQLPQLGMPLSADNKVYTGYRGGGPGALGVKDWPSGQGTSGAWPGYCTSPLVTIWNEKTSETLAITFFNDQLMSVGIFWFSGPGGSNQGFNPIFRFSGELEPRASMSLPIEFREMSGGPPAHWKFYRDNLLAPFMSAWGFPEPAEFETTANSVWGMGTDSGPGLAMAVRRLVSRYHIEGYVQWPAADQKAAFFEPHAVKYPFFSEFLTASQIGGLKHFGTLVIPDLAPLIPSDMALRQLMGENNPRPFPESVLMMNQRADPVRQYNLTYARILRDHGVTVAYYDTGGGPGNSRPPLDWLRTYADYKNAGIALMGECGADVSAWISGAWFEYPYSWNDYAMLKALLPGCGRFAYDHGPAPRDVGHGSESWWRDALRKGITPLLGEDQLSQWSAGK
jgi:hypothetical protein